MLLIFSSGYQNPLPNSTPIHSPPFYREEALPSTSARQISQSPARSIAEGNTLGDWASSTGTFAASVEQADQVHSWTLTNRKGLHMCFSHIPLTQLQRTVKQASLVQSLLTTPAYYHPTMCGNPKVSNPMSHEKLMPPTFPNLADKNISLLLLTPTFYMGYRPMKRLTRHMLPAFANIGIHSSEVKATVATMALPSLAPNSKPPHNGKVPTTQGCFTAPRAKGY